MSSTTASSGPSAALMSAPMLVGNSLPLTPTEKVSAFSSTGPRARCSGSLISSALLPVKVMPYLEEAVKPTFELRLDVDTGQDLAQKPVGLVERDHQLAAGEAAADVELAARLAGPGVPLELGAGGELESTQGEPAPARLAEEDVRLGGLGAIGGDRQLDRTIVGPGRRWHDADAALGGEDDLGQVRQRQVDGEPGAPVLAAPHVLRGGLVGLQTNRQPFLGAGVDRLELEVDDVELGDRAAGVEQHRGAARGQEALEMSQQLGVIEGRVAPAVQGVQDGRRRLEPLTQAFEVELGCLVGDIVGACMLLPLEDAEQLQPLVDAGKTLEVLDDRMIEHALGQLGEDVRRDIEPR
ncbi:hypothetical protein [Nannocystis pusilla]|uniref:hypothetical protein n=1 Tax=Nannocystis pusilla TaxID=889268 RepID=UPI003DA3F6D2